MHRYRYDLFRPMATQLAARLPQPPSFHPDGDPPADPPADPPTPPTPPPAPEPVYTKAQVEAMMKERLKRAGIDPTESIELETLRQEKLERDRRDAEEKRQYDRALKSVRDEAERKVKEAEEKRMSLLKEVEDEKISNGILGSKTIAGAINPAQVAALTRHQVKFDPETRTVVYLDETGQPGFKNGVPWTADDMLTVWREKNRHMFKAASDDPGSGAGGSGASDHGSGMGDDFDGQEKKLADVHTAAVKKAQTTGNPSDITAAHVAKRALDDYKRARAAAKAKGAVV